MPNNNKDRNKKPLNEVVNPDPREKLPTPSKPQKGKEK